MLDIRVVGADDLTGVAGVLIDSWRAAYRDIVPAELLTSQTVEGRRAHLERKLREGIARRTMLVAYDRSEAVGTIWVGPEQGADRDTLVGEVYAIYVVEREWHAGVGKALMERGIAELRNNGFTSAVLWVLHNNEMAQRFYERNGWRRTSAIKLEEWGTFQLQELRYVFSPL